MFSPSTERFTGSPGSPGVEPMNLGSPVSSPSSLNNSLNFLPSYLIRDTGSSSSTFIQQTSWNTPVKQSNNTQFSPILARKSLYQSSPTSGALIGSPNVTKPGGPPVQGLFDSIASPKGIRSNFNKLENSLDISNLSYEGNQLCSTNFYSPNHSFIQNNSTYMSPAQIDPFFTQGEALTSESQLDETWITVFGFPSAATSFILQQFSQYGKIAEHKASSTGNWIHIKYQSKVQAKKALSKNGKIFDNIMLGVKPCIEMDIINNTEKENREQSVIYTPETVKDFDTSKRCLKSIRPLTQIYKSPGKEMDVASPQTKFQPKSIGFVSKAMEYVMNW